MDIFKYIPVPLRVSSAIFSALALYNNGANRKMKREIDSLGQLEPKTVRSANVMRTSKI